MSRTARLRRFVLPARVRQFLAYAAVFASGGASIATSGCTDENSATTPPVAVELGAIGSRSVLRFRVRSTFGIARLDVGARFVDGSGAATVEVPAELADADAGLLGSPDGGVRSSFDVAGPEARTQTVCVGSCATEVEVTVTRTAGSEPASLEVWFGATTTAYDSCSNEEYTFIVERVE